MENLNNNVREIPYWKNILVNCPSCWFKWDPEKYRKWNDILEIVLYIPFIIPWLLYSARRHINTVCLCPKCWEINIQEIDNDNNLVNSMLKIHKNQMDNFWLIVVLFLFLGILGFFLESGSYQQNLNYKTKNNYNINTPVISNSTQWYNTYHDNDYVLNDIEEDDDIRNIVQWVVDWINKTYKEDYFQKNDNFSWAYCIWDCENWFINIDWSAYPFINRYDDIVTWIARSNAVNLSFWMWNKPITVNLNIWWKLFVTCYWANTVIHCEKWNYYGE